jgi:hypothetical protein
VVERLNLPVQNHVRFHASRAKEVFSAYSELRSLAPSERERSSHCEGSYERHYEEWLSWALRRECSLALTSELPSSGSLL